MRVPATVPIGDPAGTRLDRSHPFPADLTDLPLVQLQVPRSRICRRLDHEYLTDPAGPHPVTQERHREVLVELDARDCLAPDPGTIR